jgi:UDP-2,4-diacetamido-2,4,6-trideoxy-beta-L-altropyranose hydrolase
MRCLTLADQLTQDGLVCHFIIRKQLGSLENLIVSRRHTLHLLPEIIKDAETGSPTTAHLKSAKALNYECWLAGGWARDAEQSLNIISHIKPDWLIVDHYGIDERWEEVFLEVCENILVIDDLANRKHKCSLLLDQSFMQSQDKYRGLVPPGIELLCGSQYSLLRPQFAASRELSLQRRTPPKLVRLLVTMGGVDKTNITSEVLTTLKHSDLVSISQITVVMGFAAPWVDDVRVQAEAMPCATSVLVGVENMALLMAEHDLGICAAGSTVWECCCLGLPSILIVTAENQKENCKILASHNVVQMIGSADLVRKELVSKVEFFAGDLKELSKCTEQMKHITAGLGAKIVGKKILAKCTGNNGGINYA